MSDPTRRRADPCQGVGILTLQGEGQDTIGFSYSPAIRSLLRQLSGTGGKLPPEGNSGGGSPIRLYDENQIYPPETAKSPFFTAGAKTAAGPVPGRVAGYCTIFMPPFSELLSISGVAG
jgi:hypothetical protein